MENLPARLQGILAFIQTHTAERGYAPSVREIGAARGIASSSTVHACLKQLEDAGFLRRDPLKPRAIVLQKTDAKSSSGDIIPETENKGLTGDSERPFFVGDLQKVPFIPFEALGLGSQTSDASAHWYLPKPPLNQTSCFMTCMPDDSMIHRQLSAGDYLLVKIQNTAESSELIVGQTAGKTLVRTYTKGLRQVRLQAEQDDAETLTLDAAQLNILGVVVGFVHMF